MVLWPSTTLGYYSLSPMSHVVAFTATAIMLTAWWRAREGLSLRAWVLFGLAAGVMTLCRWQDVLLLLMPLVWECAGIVRGRVDVRTGSYWRTCLSDAG